MALSTRFKAIALALALGLAGCGGGGSDIASPGATNPGTAPGGGTGGGGTGGGGTAACPTGLTTLASVAGQTVCQVTGSVLSNTTLRNIPGVLYRLSGRVDVGADIGGDGNRAGGQRATLTIEPGVTLFGESGGDYLVVNRGSQLVADGTASQPIVFTSRPGLERAAAGTEANAIDNIGEWGGVVILGRAPIKNCAAAGAVGGTAGCEAAIEGVSGAPALYGGALANDRSGKLEYVRVQFAGFPLPGTTGNELNGITFGGVGNETEVDFVQVHNNADDGVEFFGGTVNVRHLVLTGNDDDSVDWDTGYTGSIQFLVIQQRANGGDNGFELSSAGASATPVSNGTVSNFTFVSARPTTASSATAGNAFRMNSGTNGRFANGVVSLPRQCFRFEASAGAPTFQSILFDCEAGLATSNSDVARITSIIGASPNTTTTTPDTLAGLFPGANETARTAVNPTTLGAFFQPASYIGAFSPTENEANSWASGWTFRLFQTAGCPTGTTENGTLNGQRLCVLAGSFPNRAGSGGASTSPADVRLTRGNIYQISGRVDVGLDVGGGATANATGRAGSLTIDAGVTLFGASGSDYIVVNRGGRLFANGTRSSPIVMTSQRDVNNVAGDRTDAIGEWGGLVILGRAPIKNCAASGAVGGTAGCEAAIEGVSGSPALYGGEVSTDNSGVLNYLQVKFAGFPLPGTTGNELNGITFGGVGSGTTVEFVQVHNNADDGVEFFGGNVDARYVVLTGNDDDSVDWDTGYTGNIQYLLVVQRTNGGDNGFELSSSGASAAPVSNGTVANFTVVSTRPTTASSATAGNAFRMNSGTNGTFANGVVSVLRECFRFESSAGSPTFNSILFDCGAGLATANSDGARITSIVGAGANNSTTTPDTLSSVFVNGATESARTAVSVSTLPAFFQRPNFLGQPANYIGAVSGPTDTWWQTWTCGLQTSTPC